MRFSSRMIIGLLTLCLLPGLASARPRDLVKRLNNSEAYLDDMMEAPDTQIPTAIMKDCKGIIIMREYRVGFGVGVKGGYGIAMVKDEKTGAWSPPVFMNAGQGSIGIQIGGQSIDSIIMIMNEEGMKMLLKTKAKVGVDASAAVGPVGRDAAAKVGPGTALLVYSRAKGLYAGASFEGGFVVTDDEANARFYSVPGIKAKDILFNAKVTMPDEAKHLVGSLEAYAKPEAK